MVKFCPTALLSQTTVNGVTYYVYQGNYCSPTGPMPATIQWPAPIPQPWGNCGNTTNCIDVAGAGPNSLAPSGPTDANPEPPTENA